MGLSNFTPGNDDDSTNNPIGSSAGSGAPNIVSVGPSAPSHNHTITGSSEIGDMLINYNEEHKKSSPALFRDEIVTQTMSIISSSRKPNALLVGPAGVGKTAIVEEIARRIANQEASVPPQLKDTTIYELPIATLVAGAGIVGELENRITDRHSSVASRLSSSMSLTESRPVRFSMSFCPACSPTTRTRSVLHLMSSMTSLLLLID